METDVGVDESVSEAVIRAVSAIAGNVPTDMPPLSEVIDTDALDGLFSPRSDGTPRPGGRVSFVYADCRLTVENGEYLLVEPFDILPHVPKENGTVRRNAPADR